MWCELQKSRNPNFNPYMVWRALFGCLERGPLSNYEEFEATHLMEIIAWKDFYAPTYTDVFGRIPKVVPPSGKDKEKKEEGSGKSEDEDQKSGKMVNPPPFNPMAQFFAQFFRDYQG
jgi:hypothetical protein